MSSAAWRWILASFVSLKKKKKVKHELHSMQCSWIRKWHAVPPSIQADHVPNGQPSMSTESCMNDEKRLFLAEVTSQFVKCLVRKIIHSKGKKGHKKRYIYICRWKYFKHHPKVGFGHWKTSYQSQVTSKKNPLVCDDYRWSGMLVSLKGQKIWRTASFKI